MIRAIIVDDEMRSQSLLFKLLERFCPDVEVVGFASSVQSAVEIINQENPELVFLDISMPDGDGFQSAGHRAGRRKSRDDKALGVQPENR